MNEISGQRDGAMGRDEDADRLAEAREECDAQLDTAVSMGRLLDADVPKVYRSLNCATEVVILPCGFELATHALGSKRRGALREHGLVGYRTPRQLGLESCPRLTLNAAADILDNLEARLAKVERDCLGEAGKSVFDSDDDRGADVVRAEVSGEGAEGNHLSELTDVEKEELKELLDNTTDFGEPEIHRCGNDISPDEHGTKILHLPSAAGRENMGGLDTDPE